MNDREDTAYPIISYASQVIDGRWYEAESIIIRCPTSACRYAVDVIKSPWKEAESTIGRHDMAAFCYYNIFGRDITKKSFLLSFLSFFSLRILSYFGPL